VVSHTRLKNANCEPENLKKKARPGAGAKTAAAAYGPLKNVPNSTRGKRNVAKKKNAGAGKPTKPSPAPNRNSPPRRRQKRRQRNDTSPKRKQRATSGKQKNTKPKKRRHGPFQQAEEAPIDSLRVVVRSHPLPDTKHPGFTTLKVMPEPEHSDPVRVEWQVGHRRHAHLGSEVAMDWPRCDTRKTVRYVIRARPARGATSWTVTRRGRLTLGNVKHCHYLEQQERRQRRREAAGILHRIEQEEAELKRFEHNCRALGGEPVTIQSQEGDERTCRKPGGGIIPVPD
jgi:hypothetical protein